MDQQGSSLLIGGGGGVGGEELLTNLNGRRTSQKRSKFKCADIFKGYSRVYLVRLCEIGAGDKIYTPLC